VRPSPPAVCAGGVCRAGRPVAGLAGGAGVPASLLRARLALVGDAGYYKDPITTHGITAGLRDAELLANAVLDALGGSVPEHVALSGYQAARDRLSGPLFSATEAVAAYDWDTVAVRTLLRQVSSAMGHELELFPELVGSV
jgi:flavin-dependent dehydrogenase